MAQEEEEESCNATTWLQRMSLFCTELQSFVTNEVPHDARLQDYAEGARHLQLLLETKQQQYPALFKESKFKDCCYMQGITGLDAEIKHVHQLGVQTCNLINNHPAFGVFQGNPETRVQPFFERQLNMCMALGVEHLLQK
jgi:hypothetical protein